MGDRMGYLKLIFLLLLPGSVLAQQVDPDWAVRVTWLANPSDEQVEKYTISWFDGDINSFRSLDEVEHEDNASMVYVTRLSWIKSTLRVGNEICFSITAHRGDETSERSQNGCITIIQLGESVSAIELSAPAKPVPTLFIEGN